MRLPHGTAARAVAYQQNKDLNEEKLAREASKLRVLSIGHLIKNKEIHRPHWIPDEDTKAEHCADEDIPQDIDEYCTIASKKNFWIDTLLLTSLMQRLGAVIITFKWCKFEKMWKRTVLADRFSGTRAVGAQKGVGYITMMLIDDHYWFLKPPEPTCALPEAWMHKTPERPRGYLRGAGKSTSHASLAIPPKTPSRKPSHAASKTGLSLKLPAATPRPSLRTSANSSKLRIPESETATSSLGFAGTCQSLKSNTVSKNGQGSKVTQQSSTQTAKPLVAGVSGPQNKIKSEEAYWICPFPQCGFQVDNSLYSLPKDKKPQRRKKHLNRVHKLKGEKVKDLTRKERMERVIELQKVPLSVHHVSRPGIQFSLNLPVFPSSSASSSSISEVWGRCTCGFEVRRSSENEQRRIKWKHLRTEHGIRRNNYAGQRENAAANTPKRLHACRDSLQIRWQHLWKAFSKAKWPGSHDLPIEATHWCGHNVKTGVKSFKPFHVCKLCGSQVERHSWYLYSCPATKRRKPLPTLKERKVIWAKCRKEAQQSVKLSKLADGTSAAKKGLRAKRLGEAKNPDTTNKELLQTAQKNAVDVLLLQEINVGKHGEISLLHKAQRYGWQAFHVARPTKDIE